MGNILNDIVDEVNIKPNKNKLILKWVISIATSLIVVAYVFGQFKSAFFNRMDKLENTVIETKSSVSEIKSDMNKGFEDVNVRIDKGYSDGIEILQGYQEFNKKQLILVLDYGQTNKELLKEMLQINMEEKAKSVENQIMQARSEPVITAQNPEFSINVKPFTPEKKTKDYISLTHMVEIETNDTVFVLIGATEEFINNIDRNKYQVGAMVQNDVHPNLFDVNYRNK